MENKKKAEQPSDRTSDEPDNRLRHKDRLPPEWPWWQVPLVSVGELLVYGSGLVLAATCLNLLLKNPNPIGLDCACWIYIPGTFFLIGLYMVRLIRHDFRVHEARLVDRTEAEALFLEARTLLKTGTKPTDNAIQRDLLEELIDQRDTEGPKTWTEYRVLPVEQGLLLHLSKEYLLARARSRQEDLKEYNEKKTQAETTYFKDHEDRVSDVSAYGTELVLV